MSLMNDPSPILHWPAFEKNTISRARGDSMLYFMFLQTRGSYWNGNAYRSKLSPLKKAKLKFYEPEEEVRENCQGCAYVSSIGATWTPMVLTQFLLGIMASRVTCPSQNPAWTKANQKILVATTFVQLNDRIFYLGLEGSMHQGTSKDLYWF